MKYIFKFSIIKILALIFLISVNQTTFAQNASFEEAFKVLESSLTVYFDAQLSSEIDTTSSSGRNALYAEKQLVKAKIELIKSDLEKGDVYLSLDSPNSAVLVSLVYSMLVFEELDLKFVEQFLNAMFNKKMLNQDDKRCIIGALEEYKVAQTSFKDFSKKENANEIQLYFSSISGFFKGCISKSY
ncbi:hypothetical protein [Marivirga sp.]|uniref:hypothetical protein n=1 Tax=Marivirga sp. TaxID=2018662 RepID=UPI002D7F33B6|nr:hypothetical protein [Marivirga sp.]HET8861595.1 hypothetical protein [Marivirga sp.]